MTGLCYERRVPLIQSEVRSMQQLESGADPGQNPRTSSPRFLHVWAKGLSASAHLALCLTLVPAFSASTHLSQVLPPLVSTSGTTVDALVAGQFSLNSCLMQCPPCTRVPIAAFSPDLNLCSIPGNEKTVKLGHMQSPQPPAPSPILHLLSHHCITITCPFLHMHSP